MKDITLQTYRERLMRVLVHLQDRLDEEWTLEDLAKRSGFSPFHFHRIFRALVGESVHQYVRRLRLERAAYRLRYSPQPIVELAFDAGYETHGSFTRAFRAMFGVSPSAFRAQGLPHLPAAAGGISVGFAADHDERSLLMDAVLKKLEPQRIAFIRHVGPYAEVGGAFQRLCAWAGPKGLLGPNNPLLGVAYDDPAVTPQDKIRFDAAVFVGPDVHAEGEVGIRELPGGEYAVIRHEGPYDSLKSSYEFVYGQWLAKSAREPADAPPFEVYLNDPTSTPPDKLLTDIHVPLKPA